jgi:hypothetical protein
MGGLISMRPRPPPRFSETDPPALARCWGNIKRPGHQALATLAEFAGHVAHGAR